ncbi:BaiN/RdsA family NAD(P)/FAD-dependent oxidoreductase [Bovifimicola ammoniilytica]|uniref:NAD(P)/FAD-dependent oxidoreductase n=1 Tax=Bovifimicola ammoniilytica TaxID=2981720 RepID=UPI00082227DF|nr:NAD(P)/FAD-dependent oxidoreductase [Bovifimicola ammoniilytica]MCU6752589.1 NAD(P)/FAD-dependent oxidoreductase [Bovifimicola ammoniilytica]SCJ30032.1 D-amino acid dehydrogenase small subunit [uncultured Eubacterium sp.]
MADRKVIVIGAGAAGMMAAYSSALCGNKVTVFERNEKAGKKLFITGKGRCNITNDSDVETILNNIITNRKFMYSAIYSFSNEDVKAFFEENGLHLKVERGNRIFPVSDKSSDVINTLKKALRNENVEIEYNILVKDLVVENNTVKGVVLKDGRKVYADKVIMATGGMSYPVTGSDGKGFDILRKYGHTITDLSPALVPMNVKEEFAKELQGLSLKNVDISFYRNEVDKKPVYEEFGEMLFTHFGISGPIVLSGSSVAGKYLKEGNLIARIDLKPALSKEQLDDRILREFTNGINKDIVNVMDNLLPKKLIPVMLDYCEIESHKKVNSISKEERNRMVEAFKGLKLTITSLRSFNEAIITQGGIKVKEVDPGTMESKIISNLYLAGEMLDVDALTGGYNLQIAWSTGRLAGMEY